MVSIVVNRWLQAGQSLRRRIDVPSSVERESTTRVSAERQKGQFMVTSGQNIEPSPDLDPPSWG